MSRQQQNYFGKILEYLNGLIQKMISIIPTPIGNTEDITLRALRLMKELDIFLCEDTRTSKKLFKIYEIDYSKKKFYSITSFTSKGKLEFYEKLLKENNVGILSEAGSPGLSDPGKSIVKILWENKLEFEVLPGSNALIPAVVAAPMDSSEFLYMGFLPTKKGRQTKIKKIINSKKPVFLYESVHRIYKLILQLKENGFEGNIGIFREISKMHEEKIYDNIDNIIEKFKSGKIKEKGEFVVCIYNITS
ncbi:16S rRNA (cytidine(1402)-2'-O)-methyltransferase [Candidatus Absconditicoccus praedator]|uniref:16S rRNA (cytidine(1402)-2'-O)-methyltransferase n=1 Tax=Candidatus Absconditicoccus praedator TaxID=2735562 RepID=UPI001E369BBF|nr:16S rRNA (cytidine(1402)-2'-O)-methyltransferase [Candidatus Absconditicoccus praedator]UFX82879.1 16S rRNA (cytidine(1402)-2'-O)-methyltransferase [Candidatus Absconditicoccus praedator]